MQPGAIVIGRSGASSYEKRGAEIRPYALPNIVLKLSRHFLDVSNSE